MLVRLGQEVQEVPRGLSPDPVREFIRAFNEQDLDAFEATLDPEVQIHAARGLRKGKEAARIWATRAPGGVQQEIMLDELYEGEESAVALITRRWRWAEDGSLAREEPMAWLFALKGGRIAGWRAFEDRAEALREGGFAHQ